MGHRDLSAVDKLTTEEHWKNFHDFCYYDMLSGGPDAHLTLAGNMSMALPFTERVWHAGVYAGVYNVPTAELLWSEFPHKEMLKISLHDLTQWLTENWKGIATRRERKCVRIPGNMAFYLKNFAEFAPTLKRSKYLDTTDGTFESRYDELSEYAQKSVKYLGRYSSFKLLEFLTGYCDFPIRLPDIRPKDGWSPRSMLSILYPKHADVLMGDNSEATLKKVQSIADEALVRLNSSDLAMDNFKLQVFLCDYKQCYFGRRQYPGRSQDSEIEYMTKLQEFWDFDFEMVAPESKIFPHWALGELNGWTKVRGELGTVLYDHGYMWSDSLYDYNATTDLSNPVKVKA